MRSHIFVSLGVLCVVALTPLCSRAQFQPIPKEELTMSSDPAAPGAAAVYLYREETTDDPHAFRTVYARIKVLTEEGKSAAMIHIDFPQTFVFNAQGTNSSRMTGGFGSGVIDPSEKPGPNTAHWSVPNAAHLGEDAPRDA